MRRVKTVSPAALSSLNSFRLLRNVSVAPYIATKITFLFLQGEIKNRWVLVPKSRYQYPTSIGVNANGIQPKDFPWGEVFLSFSIFLSL